MAFQRIAPKGAQKMYFINYKEKNNANLTFIFALFFIAERNPKEKLKNIIKFKSLNQLLNKFKESLNYNISISTLNRYLKNENNYIFFEYKPKEKIIYLKNDFRNKKNVTFVTLTRKEILFLIAQNDDFLNNYYLYLKYYCNYSKSKTNDFTSV